MNRIPGHRGRYLTKPFYGGYYEMAKKVQFVETVLRDANQSLIATRLPYDKFEPMLETIDRPAITPSSAGAAPPSTCACAT